MSRKLWLALAALVVAGVVATWLTGRFDNGRNSHDVVQADVAHEKHVEQGKASARVDTLVRTIYVHEKALTAKADSLDAVADTLGQHAKTVRDSLDMWRGRDSVHVAELAAVRAAKDSADRRAALFAVDRDRWKKDAAGADQINQGLKRDLQHVNDCHVLPFIPCPSRKVALGAGILAGLAITHPEQTKRIITLGR
jgi:hypothetical protein